MSILKCPICDALGDSFTLIADVYTDIKISKTGEVLRLAYPNLRSEDLAESIINNDHIMLYCNECGSSFRADWNSDGTIGVKEDYYLFLAEKRGS